MAKPIPLIILAIFLTASLVGAQLSREQSQQTRLQEARQCRIQRLSASRPNQHIRSEGGETELWNEFEEQFQCAGVAAYRNVIEPNSLSLPNFSPSPILVYIQQGQGLVGLSNPGCPESYHSGEQSRPRTSPSRGQRGEQTDQHQKVHRIRQGDIVAIPAGVAHWCHNDGNEDLVAVYVTDLNNNANQLEQKLRSFYLAGGQSQQQQQRSLRSPRESQQQRETFQNIFRPFDEELMAQAFNIPLNVVRRMQQEDPRGLIVRVKGDQGLSTIRPESREEEYGRGRQANGLEETYCNMKIREYLDNPREADVYSRQAGRINIVNNQKLPILNSMGMSAEKANLYPNAMHAPHWSMNAHSIVYVTRGEAHVQVVGSNGQRVLDNRVNQGDMFVVPQYFVSTIRAGNEGCEYVAFKTSSNPMKSPLVGKTSALKAMPIQVLTNSYQISSQEAQSLKYNREEQTILLPPRSTRSSS